MTLEIGGRRRVLTAKLFLFLTAAMLFAQEAPLRQFAEQRGIRIGTAVDARALSSEPRYAETLAREFNQVEPENAAKFGLIHPQQDTYNFGPVDALVAFAKDHKMAVRGHTLVWHNQNPAWLTRGQFTQEQLAGILHDHIGKVVGHYAGQIYAWDVVNEAFNDDGSLRKTIWSASPGIGKEGTGYIEQALRWAHEADPKALLFYNDYSAEGMNAKSDGIYAMVKDFKSRGVPLDGVGLQMHLTEHPPAMEKIEANLRRLTELGVQVQYTELDVRIPVGSEEALATEARIYGEVTGLCLKFAKCTAIQVWGFTDAHSWIPRQYPGLGAALVFDADYRPKAAYRAVAEALGRGK